jgi:hypothetical protein
MTRFIRSSRAAASAPSGDPGGGAERRRGVWPGTQVRKGAEDASLPVLIDARVGATSASSGS